MERKVWAGQVRGGASRAGWEQRGLAGIQVYRCPGGWGRAPVEGGRGCWGRGRGCGGGVRVRAGGLRGARDVGDRKPGAPTVWDERGAQRVGHRGNWAWTWRGQV